MFSCTDFGNGYWWVFPLFMIVMMVVCFVMMRGRMGFMNCMPGRRGMGGRGEDAGGTATEVLDKRYARGEIDRKEYEEKKRALTA